ncbi:MAG: hypothetical protein IPM32_06190 [Ignavibacteriae bacterium]|nr:hypothetical protein [Ignavibacteriota bacterium]
MGGKAALLLVLGFSSILLIIGLNFNSVSGSAADNSGKYFEQVLAKEIARTGINLAASNIAKNPGWTPDGNPYSFNGEDNLVISVNDTGDIKTISAFGEYKGVTKFIEVKVRAASFSEFAYFSDEEAPPGKEIWWTKKDSVWGPFHTNDVLRVAKHPYFNGPSTSHGGSLIYQSDAAADEPVIVGDYNPGLTISLPTDGVSGLSSKAAETGGYTFSGQAEVFLEFAGDSIKYKFNAADAYTTVLGSNLAPSGIIYVNNGNLRLKGTVKGKWSVGTNQSVYLDDDIVYSDIPDYTDKNDPSNDILGILSKDNVYITNNADNATDINIHASIYVENGGFMAEDYESRPVSGYINLIGGVTQKTRQGVGTFNTNSGNPESGFAKNYRYDNRLQRMVPPYFPSTNTFRILSWLE